jgi:PKD repeat protein
MWALAGGSGGAAYPAQSLYDHLRWTPGSLNDVIAGGNGFCGGGSAADCSARVRALTDKTALPATQVGTLGGVATGNPNNITNGNQDWGTQGWVGPVDCSFAYPTYDANTDTYTAAGEDINPDSTECNAAVGFDGPSGVGSPHGLSAFTRMGPTVTIGAPSLLKVKTTATFRVASFSDNIPNTSAARYKWTWGDGTSTTTTALSAAHAFAKAGTYRITLTVRDTQDRLYSVAKTYRLGYAPTVAITGPSTVKRYVKNTWHAAVTEPNTGGKVTSYAWHISGSTAVFSRSASLTASFHAGTHYVSVTVTDDSGFHATKSFKITTT